MSGSTGFRNIPIEPFGQHRTDNSLIGFYPAEEHHQNFCNRNPRNSYVVNIAMPRVEKVKEALPELVKKK